MKQNLNQWNNQSPDLFAALNFVRQAILTLPEEMEELMEDLKWVEESIQAALTEDTRAQEETVMGGLGA